MVERKYTHALGRRLFLRGVVGGASVTVALPILEGMLSGNGTAFADGAPKPTRFGVWYFGNGVNPVEWGADGAGSAWTPRTALKPIAEGWGRNYVTVLSGLTVPDYSLSATYKNDPLHNYSQGHHSGAATVLSGDQFERRVSDVAQDGAISSHFRHRTVDQEAAAYFASKGLSAGTAYPSLQLSIVGEQSTKEGPTFRSISQNGGGSENLGIYDPATLFERLFGVNPGAMAFKGSRASVLDAVREDMKSLEPRLSAADRARVEQHLDGVRGIEQRMAMESVTCAPPVRPGAHPKLATDDDIVPKNAAFVELLTHALACGMTHVFSVAFTRVGNPLRHAASGLKAHNHHITTHSGGDWKTPVGRATVFTMQQLRVLMNALYNTPDGDGNLLDNVSILVASEHADGSTHDVLKTGLPSLIIGKGGGRLKGNQHWARKSTSEYITKASFTALRGAGVDLPTWGRGVAVARSPVTEVFR